MTTTPHATDEDMKLLPYQQRVLNWLMECFSNEICRDITERNHRFLEESLELVQSTGCTASEAHQLVDYVFARPVGEPLQEAGGVRVTFAALCSAIDIDENMAGETELARVWTKIDKIRAKQLAKPKHSPLPESVAPPLSLPHSGEPIARLEPSDRKMADGHRPISDFSTGYKFPPTTQIGGGVEALLESLGDWCGAERYKLGAVDGYDYRSGEEFGLRRAEIEIGKRRSTLLAAPKPQRAVARETIASKMYDHHESKFLCAPLPWSKANSYVKNQWLELADIVLTPTELHEGGE